MNNPFAILIIFVLIAFLFWESINTFLNSFSRFREFMKVRYVDNPDHMIPTRVFLTDLAILAVSLSSSGAITVGIFIAFQGPVFHD